MIDTECIVYLSDTGVVISGICYNKRFQYKKGDISITYTSGDPEGRNINLFYVIFKNRKVFFQRGNMPCDFYGNIFFLLILAIESTERTVNR